MFDTSNNDRPHDSCDSRPPAFDFDWDLESLKANMSGFIPNWIERETGETQLPFPPELVADVTEGEIDFLAEVCALQGKLRYSYWSDVFHAVNVAFLGKTKELQRVLDGLNSLPSEVPRIPAFLLSANAFWIEYNKAADLRGLRDLKRQGRGVQDGGVNVAQILRAHAKARLPLPQTFRLNDKADAICVMIEGIARWITINHRRRGALQSARTLLCWWEIDVTEDMIRERRKRRSKI